MSSLHTSSAPPASSWPLAPHSRRSIQGNFTVAVQPWEEWQLKASLDVWIYFNLISNTVLLPILVATILLSKHAKGRRPPLLINMCIVWIMSGIFSLLLWYDGTARPSDPPPSSALCITQLSLLYGILPMWSIAVLALTYHVYAVVSGHRATRKKIPMSFLIAAPYIVQIAFTIAGIIAVMMTSQKGTSLIKRSFFFCTLSEHPLSNATSIFVFVVCLGIILLTTRVDFLSQLEGFKISSEGSFNGATESNTGSEGLGLRRLRLCRDGLELSRCNIIRLFNPYNVIPYLYVPIAGLVVFLVFGTQSHILEAWSFWKWRRSRPRTGITLPTVNPFLTPDEHIPSPNPDWRDTSLLSPAVRVGGPDATPEMQEVLIDIPPTPPPKVQVFRRFHTDQALDSGRDRRSQSVSHVHTPVISYAAYQKARSDVV
ncbi:hypothetical protein PQX77_007061 [Marasmius sp. AFHP31]|nr:hypothetical protein PQX77_007061 [Marasmius sp. AFHP31]